MSSPRIPVARVTPEVDLLLRVLRGEAAPWPTAADAGFGDRFLAACAGEDLLPLVQHRVQSVSDASGWPIAVREALHTAARMRAAVDMLLERELITALAALADAGIGTLLLKGAALAYTHYAEPHLRTRCDTDVLIQPVDRAAARRVLERLGYERRNEIDGTLVSYQECHTKRDGAVRHVIDLHWQVNNRQVFAHALSYDEARARSVPVPQLGPAARALCPTDALLLACMHRAAHLGASGTDGDRLLWLYDIHLLATAMTSGDWQEFARLCVAKEMRRVSLDAFDRTRELFATAFPGEAIEALTQQSAAELSASYLDGRRHSGLLINLRALPTWKSRATLLRESVFPPAAYLFAKYDTQSGWLLPWWYARRVAEGLWKVSRS